MKNKKTLIIENIIKAVKEIKSWPKWKQALCGIESDYSITKIDLNKIDKIKFK